MANLMPTHNGAIRLFRAAGIDVFLHWSWILVPVFLIQWHGSQYGSPAWSAAETVAVFAIVLAHEFGHALACRSVGGRADRIVLWPLGGVAYVDPPQRPGATLWSIAAGPLVNVALVPVFLGLQEVVGRGGGGTAPDPVRFLAAVAFTNVVILLFNVLPVYPLDGGQILRSLLWYVVGRARSLMAATVVGFAGVAALGLLALKLQDTWYLLMVAFLGANCWRGFQHARALAAVARLPRRAGFRCPSCGAEPPIGAFWGCGACGATFDTFETGAACPACGARYATTRCADCLRQSPIDEWSGAAAVQPR